MKIVPIVQNYNSQTFKPSFEKEYPYADIVELLSGTHIISNKESFNKTVIGIAGQLGVEKADNSPAVYAFVRKYINYSNGYKNINKFAESFKHALKKSRSNGIFASKENNIQIISEEMKKFGRKTIDITF